MHPADLVPELDAAVTPAARPPPTPAAARTGEPTPSPCGPRSPPSGPRSPPASSPTPLEWRLPRTTAANAAAQDNPAPAARWRCAASRPDLDRHTPPGHPHPGAAPRPAPSHRRRHPRRRPARVRLPGKAAPTPICGHSPAGPPPKPNSRKPACPAASTAPTKSTSATTTKFSLRYSDDGHIARELGEPPSAGPAHNISGPRCRGQAGYPRVSTRAGPVATLRPGRPGSGRAGFGPGRVRAAEPWPSRAGGSHRPGPGRSQGRSRAHYHGARPVRQPGTMNAAPGEPQRARNLSGCQDQPPDLLLLWRRGAAAAMSAS